MVQDVDKRSGTFAGDGAGTRNRMQGYQFKVKIEGIKIRESWCIVGLKR